MDIIAVIDDDEDSRLLLSYFLGEKWKVNVYEDWEKASKAFETSPPNLILLDISLPGKKGPEILEIIRKTPPLKHIGVIAITGYAFTSDRERFLKMGFDDYISKPITDHAILIKLIEKVLNEHVKRI